MRYFKLIAVSVSCAAVISGLVAWQAGKAKTTHRLVEDAKVSRANAEHGDPAAELKLAHMYYYGQGMPRDYVEAARWYRKAADLGNARSQFSLGYLYYYGQGVPQDYLEGFRWFRKAADQGDVGAQVRLGLMSYYGQGVPQDYAEALRRYRMAADQGYPIAQDALGSMYFYGNGVSQDYAEAARWYRKAADLGNAKSQYDLGTLYYSGLGVPQDRAEASHWFRKAADQGNKDAKRALSIGLSTRMKTILIAQLVGGLLLLTLFLRQRRSHWSLREALLPFTGIFGILTPVLSWYGYTHDLIWRWTSGINVFTLFHLLLDAAIIGLLIHIMRPRRVSPTE
jgi:hypothetical protein